MDLLQMPTTFSVAGGSITVLTPGELTGGRFELFDFIVPPGHPGPGLHVHETSDELFNLLDGEAEFEVGGELMRATRGQRIIVRRGTPHTWRNASGRPLHVLVTFTPAIQMADYFAELSEQIAHHRSMPPREVMERLWSRYDTAAV